MLTTVAYRFAACALSVGALAALSGQAHALPQAGCLLPVTEASVVADRKATPVVFNPQRAFLDISETTIRVSQSLQARPSPLPRVVPAGKVYQVQVGTRATFTRYAAGTALPAGLDCIEINCPPSFPAGTTCWRCVEQVKAP
jgi:hypothetical protein